MRIGKEYKQIASKLLGCTLASYYNWDNQKRPIISLLEKYFTQKELEEFLETGSIIKMESLIEEDEQLNADFNKFYVVDISRDNVYFNKKLFWNFLFNYKDKLIILRYEDCKKYFQQYILEYYIYLSKEAEESNIDTFIISEKVNIFINKIQTLSRDLIYFIIQNLKNNFQQHINYLLESKYYLGYYAAEVLACSKLEGFIKKSTLFPEPNGENFIKGIYKEKIVKEKYDFKTNEDKDIYFAVKRYLDSMEKNEQEIKRLIDIGTKFQNVEKKEQHLNSLKKIYPK